VKTDRKASDEREMKLGALDGGDDRGEGLAEVPDSRKGLGDSRQDGFDELDGGVLYSELFGIECEVGALGGLEGAVLAGEVCDLSTGRLGVETFDVALFAGFVGGFYVGFEEVLFADDAACEVAEFAARGDGGDEDDDAVLDENLSEFGDSADIFQAILVGEAEVRIEAGAQVVAVEDDCETALLMEDTLCGVGDGGFPRAGKSAHPDGEASLVQESFLVEAVEEAVEFSMDIHF
jgi:hypothetical protein